MLPQKRTRQYKFPGSPQFLAAQCCLKACARCCTCRDALLCPPLHAFSVPIPWAVCTNLIYGKILMTDGKWALCASITQPHDQLCFHPLLLLHLPVSHAVRCLLRSKQRVLRNRQAATRSKAKKKQQFQVSDSSHDCGLDNSVGRCKESSSSTLLHIHAGGLEGLAWI